LEKKRTLSHSTPITGLVIVPECKNVKEQNRGTHTVIRFDAKGGKDEGLKEKNSKNFTRKTSYRQMGFQKIDRKPSPSLLLRLNYEEMMGKEANVRPQTNSSFIYLSGLKEKETKGKNVAEKRVLASKST